MEVVISHACPKCAGSGIYYKDTSDGMIIFDPCPTCNGTGRVGVSYADMTKIMEKLDYIVQRLDKVKE